MCSYHVNHSRFNSQHDWEWGERGARLYDHLISTNIITLIMNKGIHISSKNNEANAYGHHLESAFISH